MAPAQSCDWCGKPSTKPLCDTCAAAVAKFVRPKPPPR